MLLPSITRPLTRMPGDLSNLPAPAAQVTAVAFGVAPEFVGWHAAVLAALRERYDRLVGASAADADAALKEVPVRFFCHCV